MGDVSNLKQVLSSTQEVERQQKLQQQTEQAGQQRFTRHLQEEAEKRTQSVNDRAEIQKINEDEEAADDGEPKKRRKNDKKEPSAEDEPPEEDSTDGDDDEHGTAGEEGGPHVDVVA